MSTPALTLATAPVTWGVDFADAPTNPPWEQVLDEIEQSGIGAMELGPIGYLPEDAALLRQSLRSRKLTAVGSFVYENLHDSATAADLTGIARRACRAVAAAEGSVLVIIDRPDGERAATAGRPEAAPRLSADAWLGMLRAIENVATIAEDFGLRAVVHHHAGSYLEYEDEVDRFLNDSDLGLCLDTGHLAYAGMVAHEAIERYGDRVAHVHLKDVDASVLERVRRERIGFWDAVSSGVFCPLGRGIVDLSAVMHALDAVSYKGFATIEQDRTPGAGSPLKDLAESVAALSAAAGRAA